MISERPLSPECRLVYGCAPLEPDTAALRTLLDAPIDWRRLLRIAELERATPIVWRTLSAAAPEKIHPAAAEQLRRSAMIYEFRMARLGARLQPTLEIFRERDIPVLLLKGAAMVADVYGSFARRPMSDLDLLVHPGDAQRARQAVIDSGWPETTDPALLTLLGEGKHHMPHFVDPEGTGLRLELHTSYLPFAAPFRFDQGELWASATRATGRFAGALIPSPTHRLFHACLHFAWSHAMGAGAWRTFRDVGALMSREVDWAEFLELARRTRGTSTCYWTLRLAARMSGLPVPAEVLQALAPPGSEAMRSAVERHFVNSNAPGEDPPCPSARVHTFVWRAAVRPRWSGHGDAAPFDPTHRWERVMGTASRETSLQKVSRHAKGLGGWWSYATRTLSPFA